MVKLNFSHVCEYAVISDRGLPCIMGIFNGIETSEVPFVYPTMAVVANVSVEDQNEHTVSFEIISPSGEALTKSLNIKSHPNSVNQTIGAIGTINGINFKEFGTHKATIAVDGKSVGDVEFQIISKKE